MKNAVLISIMSLCVAEFTIFQAASFDGFLIFGDSDLDVGNACRCSDGLVWAEHLADDLDLPRATASGLRGTDHAWGGARTGFGTDTLFGSSVPTIGQQISDYLQDDNPDESTLIIVSAGWNDLVIYGSSPETIVSNISQHVSDLADAGGKQFVVPSLVPPGLFPGISPGLVDRKAGTVNELLAPELTNLEDQLGVDIYHVDFFGVVDSVIASPTKFGLTNATGSANGNRNRSAEFLFWDDFHFTTAGHRILADAAVNAIPEPSSNLLMLLGVLVCMHIVPSRRRYRRAPGEFE